MANKKHSKEDNQSQWVMIIEDNILKAVDEEESKPSFQTLRHPKSDEVAMYLFSADCQCVYEMLKFQEEHRSWLIGETIQQDGSVYLPTKADPLYIALPYLMKMTEQNDKFQLLDQIIVDDDITGCNQICKCLESKNLKVIADVKGADDFKAYRYNKTNTLKWLKKKVCAVVAALEKQGVNVSSGANSSIFQQSSKSTNVAKEDYVRYAHGIVSDYIPESLSQQLYEYMGIQEPKREKPDIQEPPHKKARTGSLEPLEDYSSGVNAVKGAGTPKLTIAQKKLTKATGMKSMASFFKPKVNK